MSVIVLEAEAREEIGKGASRRLRRLANKVPGVVYGGTKKPQSIHLLHNKLVKALENESIYSSVFQLSIGGKSEQVILKSLQRHPYKPIILHLDLQRVSDKDILVKNIPLHFINEDSAKGVKIGGKINHTMTQVELRCKAKDLPEFIEVDMKDVDLNVVIHLSDLKLPKGVELTVDISDPHHNHPVVSIHLPKVVVEEEPVAEEGIEAESSEETKDAADESEDNTEDKA